MALSNKLKEGNAMIRNARPEKNKQHIPQLKEVQMAIDGKYLQLRCAECRRNHPIISVQCQEAKKCLR